MLTPLLSEIFYSINSNPAQQRVPLRTVASGLLQFKIISETSAKTSYFMQLVISEYA